MTITYQDVEAKLESLIDGYERREPQIALANAVAEGLSAGTHVLAEAGCGTGKSFGNLIPSILWTTAVPQRRRVVYSTATKALQDQIVAKDLPDLKAFFAEHFSLHFTFCLLKGRSNYLCLNAARAVDPSEVSDLAEILRLSEVGIEDDSFHGEKSEFEDALGHEIPWGQWFKVRAESETCSQHSCSKNRQCFADKARKLAADSDIVVANHAVVFTDLRFYNALLGEYEAVIFDEAHEVRDYARNALTNEFTEGTLRGLGAELRNLVRGSFDDHSEAITEALREASGAQTTLFGSLWDLPDLARGGSSARLRAADFSDNQDAWADYAIAVRSLATAVNKILPWTLTAPASELLPAQKRLNVLKKRSTGLAGKVENLILASFDDLVRWVESEGRGAERKLTIKSCPIDVAPWLSEDLFAHATCILTSATLQVSGKFDYIAKQLGVGEYSELNVGTPFDFTSQAQFFVPELADPSKDRAKFDNQAINTIRDLVVASDGRALILFTSIKALRNAFDTLSDLLPFTCLAQGQAPNKALAAQFKADEHSVLFATKSFMTGVDFQGSTCSLVIVDKLPFPVPTEPLFEAEAEWLERRGGNSFSDLAIPAMSLVIAQAFGRLIRHRNDTGIFCLLDPRICTKSYGKRIIKTLPPAPLVRDIEQVREFFRANA